VQPSSVLPGGSTFRLERESTTSRGPSLAEPFRVDRGRGVGDFGTVYKARDPQLDRVVAIKVPRAGSVASNEDRDRLLREARSVAQSSHARIAPVHEVGEPEGLPYLVSDFVVGLTLADFLTGRRPAEREVNGEGSRFGSHRSALNEGLRAFDQRGIFFLEVLPNTVPCWLLSK
jgi:serine/threonine protein kinase